MHLHSNYQPDVINDGYILDRYFQLQLIQAVNAEEMYQDISVIDNMQVLGRGDFSTCFLKKA